MLVRAATGKAGRHHTRRERGSFIQLGETSQVRPRGSHVPGPRPHRNASQQRVNMLVRATHQMKGLLMEDVDGEVLVHGRSDFSKRDQ